MWQQRHQERKPKPRVTCKLYVSPNPELLQEAVAVAVDVFRYAGATRFKLGLDVYGLLRPDKIVAYFNSVEELHNATERLLKRLEGCPAHGVPFTAELASDGLLSWGMDPPRDQQTLGWQERESWRLWLTNRLAVALLFAKQTQSTTIEPWQFAMERLELEGVNTASWTPKRIIWEEEGMRKE